MRGEGESDAGECGTMKPRCGKFKFKFSDFVLFLYQPVDSSSLGIVRALFGNFLQFKLNDKFNFS